MKKLLVFGAVSVAAAVAANAQAFSAKNAGVAGAGKVLGVDGTAAAAHTTGIDIVYNGTILKSATLPSAGTFALGVLTLTGVTTATATVTVEVWDTTLGGAATYAAAVANGATSVGGSYASEDVVVNLVTGSTPPAGMGNFKDLQLGLHQVTAVTPEPSTYALGALGLGGLLLISRRK